MLVLTFQVGASRLALDLRQVHEVVPRIQLERVAGSPEWLAGMFVYRGRVVPVIDLHRLLGAGECPAHLSSRIVLVPLAGAGALIGLLAAQVADIRDLSPGPAPGGLCGPGQVDLGEMIADDAGILHLLDLGRLLPEPVRRLLNTVPTEPPR